MDLEKEIKRIKKNFNRDEILFIFYKLLVEEEISFTEINELYLRYLENLKQSNLSNISDLASHLAMSFQKEKTDGYEKRCAELLEKWVPDKYIKEHVLSKSNQKRRGK